MLSRFFFALALLMSPSIWAQKISTEKLSRIKPIVIQEHPTEKEDNVIFLPMYFSSSHFLDPNIKFTVPKGKAVMSVHLVYTRFRVVDTFDQSSLNKKRFDNLYKVAPQLFDSDSIVWRVFEQKKAKTEKDARSMYHGFVIFLREPPKTEDVSKEINLLYRILMDFKDTIISVPDQILYKKRKRYVETGRYLPRSYAKMKEGIRYESRSIWFREPETRMVIDSVPRKTIKGYKKKVGMYNGSLLRNTHEYDALSNKKYTGKWLVVADVTGSMAPFNAQVLAFIRQNQDLRQKSNFSFFNDGDGAPQMIKRIGSSGGIYSCTNNHFDSIYKTVSLAMKNGNGGDIPENNIEAVLVSLKKWENVDTVLMIADAKAPIKDYSLIQYLKKPVSILLCGDVNGNVPLDYWNLALKTGGSILRSDGEIRNLKRIKPGDIIELGKYTYKLTPMGLILVND